MFNVTTCVNNCQRFIDGLSVHFFFYYGLNLTPCHVWGGDWIVFIATLLVKSVASQIRLCKIVF